MSTEINPLLEPTDPPDFAAIRPEHITPAIDALLAAAEAGLERAVGPDVLPDYDALALVLDVPVERLMSAWGQVCHLQAVADTKALRAAHAENLPRIIDFGTRLGSDPRLYAKTRAVAEGAVDRPGQPLDAERRKTLDNALRDFVLGGAELQGDARSRYAAIQDRSGALSQAFGEHVLDATDAYTLDVSESRLAGVPDDVRATARATAEAAGRSGDAEGCRLTLQAPCYGPVLRLADDRDLREQLYRAYATRASEFGPAALDNSALMQELLQLRHEEAALLGHATYADLALTPKMARSPREVLDFVRDLVRRAKPAAVAELAELKRFAASELGLPDLQAWDRSYASEKLKQSRYAFSGEELRRYFTEPQVLKGLFDLLETLFEVSIRADSAPVWHPGVRYFRLWRGDTAIAAFYLDLHARPGKQAGAWMDGARTRWQRPDGALQLPVAHLVCNFAPPVGEQPALLTHDDVITLFHEIGHGLHHMLTRVEELAVSGIAGVEYDAVELPSQFMENYCWEWDVLQTLTAHVDAGAALPRQLYDRMIAARHFQSGLQLIRQTEFALFDMRLHAETDAADRVQAISNEVSAEVQPASGADGAPFHPPFYRYPHSFGHVFDGGYAAGYYGYAWALVLSADAYSAFEEAGVLDRATGARFREQILEVGGSRSAMESFKAFRGREPTIDALLRHQGLV
ncbi:MAG: M3 family metallopeptidase [Rubrivivax sp.]